MTQAQGKPLLNQAGERERLPAGKGLGLGQQIVVEVGRGAHWIA
ncbi:MAG: hypothetical protein QM522_06870 [Chitinophagaceae bacterium]|nr:hypothetical protein [Chitinophagaceae bacterium]